MLTVRGLKVRGLAPIDMDLRDGECVTLRGHSGSGKTLVLRALSDLDPSSGEVLLDGTARTDMPAPTWRRKVTYVAAEPGWWADITGDHFPQPAEMLVSRLGLKPEILAAPVQLLSTGERQRLAIARMLLLNTRVMLLDEPTAALDPDAKGRVEELVAERLAAGASLLLVTHEDEQAARLGARKLEIRNGVLTESTS